MKWGESGESSMHKSSYLRMQYLVQYYEPYFTMEDNVIRVLDVGSFDVNGTYRDIFPVKYDYTGLDMCAGPNVDIVPKDIYHWNEIGDHEFDLVISGQAFEHIEYPWLTIKEIARVMKPSGFCIITAPNATPEHRWPTDCYRYFSDGLAALAKWADLKTFHVSVGGVPSMYGTEDWLTRDNDAYLVAQKKPYYENMINDPFKYERRITVGRGEENKYRTWELAIQEVKAQFEENKPIILFGAGEVGSLVMDRLEDTNVYCFADNSEDKVGRSYRGKKVISLDELKRIHNEYNILITALYRASLEIQKDLNRYQIKSLILYPNE